MEATIALAVAGVVLTWGFAFYWISLRFFSRRTPEQVVNYFIGKGYAGPKGKDTERFAERMRNFLGPVTVVILVALIALSIHFAVSLGMLLTHVVQHGYLGNEGAAGACAVEFSIIMFGLLLVRLLEKVRGACRGYIWKMHPVPSDPSSWTPSPLAKG